MTLRKTLLLFFLCFTFLSAISSNVEKLIIDTDAGSDDGIAILMLLRAELVQPDKYQIIAITCSYGNTKEENVEKNVLKILTVANRSDIPIYGGSKKPLIGVFPPSTYHGNDGFGDSNFSLPIEGRINESMHASIALIELTKQHQGNISIITLGPTTNVAFAISLDEKFVTRVKKFHVMGSSVAGIGRHKPNVEFNFAADPESNNILFNSTTSSQLTLFPHEANYNTKIPKDWRTEVFGKIKSPFIEFLNAIERISLSHSEDLTYRPTDALSVFTMLWPQSVKSSIETNVEPVIDGAARGSVLVDYLSIRENHIPNNAKVILSIDDEMFKEAMIYYLTCEKVAC